jgi:hypothetical protein
MIGILLIIVGAVGLIWGGVTYVKDRDTVDLGVAKIVTEEKDRISIPPVFGAVALVAGGLLVGFSSRKTRKQGA